MWKEIFIAISIIGLLYWLNAYASYYKKMKKWHKLYPYIIFQQFITPLPIPIPYFVPVKFTAIWEIVYQYKDTHPVLAYCAGKLFRLWVNDAKLIHQICVTKRANFEKPWREYKTLENNHGPNILTSKDTGAHWKKYRRIAEPAFSQEHLEYVAKVSNHHAGKMMEVIEKKTNDLKTSINMVELLNVVTLSVIARTAFGVDIEFWKKMEIPKGHQLSLLDATNMAVADAPIYRFIFPSWVRYICQHIPIPNPIKKFEAALDETNLYLFEILSEMKEKLKKSTKEDDKIDNLMTYLIEATDENGTKLTEDEIVSNEFIFVFAGYETSSASLAWTLSELAKRRDLQDAIHQEAMRIEGEATLDDYVKGKLAFAKTCIKEGLRLHPPVSYVPKQAVKTTTLVDEDGNSHTIKKGHIIISNVKGVHHREKYWGKDVLTYNPYRWDKNRITPGSYLPFSLGLRKCIGFEFSYIETTIILSHICKHYTFTLDPNYDSNQQFKPAVRIVRGPTELKLHFTKRYN